MQMMALQRPRTCIPVRAPHYQTVRSAPPLLQKIPQSLQYLYREGHCKDRCCVHGLERMRGLHCIGPPANEAARP